MAKRSREESEISEKAWNESFGPRGAGDGDWYGYPGEDDIILSEVELEDILSDPAYKPF